MKVKLLLLSMISTSAIAQNSVVVIPLFDDNVLSIKNVIKVSPSGGDFTSPIAALESITDNAPGNGYLVVIGPGIYDLSDTLVMKSFVNISGSGEVLTLLRGSIASDQPNESSALIVGAAISRLSNLSVSNSTGGAGTPAGAHSIGLYSNSDNPELENVSVSATGGSSNYGLYNTSASPRVKNSKISAGVAGIDSFNYGVYNVNQSDPKIKDSEIYADSGLSNVGVYSLSSSPFLDGVTIRAQSGSVINQGFFVDGGLPEINNSHISGNDAGFLAALSIGESELRIRQTTIFGPVRINTGASGSLSQSSIFGDISGDGNIRCAASDNAFGTPLDLSCQPDF